MYQIDLILFYIQDASKFTVQMESERSYDSKFIFLGNPRIPLFEILLLIKRDVFIFTRVEHAREEAVYLGGATVSRKDNKATYQDHS